MESACETKIFPISNSLRDIGFMLGISTLYNRENIVSITKS